MSHYRLPRSGFYIFAIGIIAMLAACGTTQQEPVGMNSGSTQYARGTFLFDDPNAVKGKVGDTLHIYNVFTTSTTEVTINSVSTSTTPANQNTASITIPDGFQFVLINITLKNLGSSDTKTCPQSSCTEYYSPLSNFRLLDDQDRQWTTTTGAQEACSTSPHTPCYNRLWMQEALNGVSTGSSFSTRLDFMIPTNVHSLTLYFAPYRFSTIQNTDYASATATTSTTTSTTTTSAATTPIATNTAAASTATPVSTNNTPTLAIISIGI